MSVVDPVVCLLGPAALPNLLEDFHNLAGHMAEILALCAVLAVIAVFVGEFVHHNMGPIKPL